MFSGLGNRNVCESFMSAEKREGRAALESEDHIQHLPAGEVVVSAVVSPCIF